VVVDEAHRMGTHYFAGKLEKTKRLQLGEQLGDIARHPTADDGHLAQRQGRRLPASSSRC
jgi:hypothetical protein